MKEKVSAKFPVCSTVPPLNGGYTVVPENFANESTIDIN